jgi:hypothetical protein
MEPQPDAEKIPRWTPSQQLNSPMPRKFHGWYARHSLAGPIHLFEAIAEILQASG